MRTAARIASLDNDDGDDDRDDDESDGCFGETHGWEVIDGP